MPSHYNMGRRNTSSRRRRRRSARGRVPTSRSQLMRNRQRNPRPAVGRPASMGAVGAKPSFIPAKYKNKITKKGVDGTSEHFWCTGTTITNDCVKVQNTVNQNKNWIAQSGGIGKKGPGRR